MYRLMYWLIWGEVPEKPEPPHRCQEFTRWRNCHIKTRIVSNGEKALPEEDTYILDKYWQERRCTLCGAIEQRNVVHPIDEESDDWDDEE